MKLTLIRHSKTNIQPKVPNVLWGLSSEGQSLAQKLAKEKVIKDVDVIYSSLQTKALETAVILAKENQIPIKTDDQLTEISSFTLKFLGKEYEQITHDYFSGKIIRVGKGESMEESLSRFMETIDKIVEIEKKNKAKNIGIVSHGNILSLFASVFTRKSVIDIHNKILMPDVAILDWKKKKFIKIFKGIK